MPFIFDKLPAYAQKAVLAAADGVGDRHTYRTRISLGDCYCRVTVVESGDKAAVVLSQIPENRTGTSVTNAFEQIAGEVYADRLRHISPSSVMWFEHYPKGMGLAEAASFDSVELRVHCGPDGVFFLSPAWEKITGWRVAA